MTATTSPSRILIVLLALAGVLAGSLWANTARSEAATVNCGTFQVLHNDRIGNLSLPRGKYAVNVINGDLFTCPKAITNFRNFLYDYDGVLPRPWKYTVLGTGKGRFYKSTNRQVGFAVRKQTAPNPTPTPIPGRYARCPGTFQVLNNDRIGPLALPKGPYYVYASTDPALSCKNAEAKFRLFLSYPSGRLPAPWVQKGAQFTNPQKGGLGFRVKQAG